MSRLESIAKAGYYPTPPSVVERAAALIRPANPTTRQAVRLLDPCCGTGAALCQLADAVGGETYGIEIARDRYDEAEAVLDHALSASAFAERLWPAEERPVRPLMPLRRGHLAVLIAAGFLNNILLEASPSTGSGQAPRRILVKGRTYKEMVPVDSGDPDVEVEREVLRTSVMALDVRTGRFEVIEH